MIKPTIGRVVLVYRPGQSDQFEPALITYVHSDMKVNVGGFAAEGGTFTFDSIELKQGNEGDFHPGPKPADSREVPFACWMPYQRAVAR